MVVMPDHLHTIWQLPDDDCDYAMRWNLIKRSFSRELPKSNELIGISRQDKQERGIWQRRYWEHTLRDEDDFERHFNYIHFNPVKHGRAIRPRYWPYSSFCRWVRLGAYPLDWADDPGNEIIGLGER